MIGRRDLRAMCRQPMGVAVTFADVSTYPDDGSPTCGLFARPVSFGVAESGMGGVENAIPTLHLPYNAFTPMPTGGDVLTLTDEDDVSTDYRVGPSSTLGDGGFLVYDLYRITDGDDA